jgi:hypothetical protein
MRRTFLARQVAQAAPVSRESTQKSRTWDYRSQDVCAASSAQPGPILIIQGCSPLAVLNLLSQAKHSRVIGERSGSRVMAGFGGARKTK